MKAQLKIICGPMFAGKTSELLRRVAAAAELPGKAPGPERLAVGQGAGSAGCERGTAGAGAGTALVFKPVRDGRYHATRVVSHDGAGMDAVPVGAASEILPVVAGVMSGPVAPVRLVAIDEAHFFGDELIAPVRELLRRELRVLVVGLERDHRGDPFAPFPTLLCEADEVVKLNSRCARCGGPAIHSQRLVDSPERIVVGGADAYEPRCRGCFVPGARGSSQPA